MAITAYLTKTPTGALSGAHPLDDEALSGLAGGAVYKAEISQSRPRSLKHHRLLWGLIKLIRDNSPCETPFTDKVILNALKLRTGHVEVARLPSGEVIMFPSSISFANMDQDAFSVWFSKAIVVMCTDFVPGLSCDIARREIEAIAAGKGAA